MAPKRSEKQRADTGHGVDPGKISKMLGILKYKKDSNSEGEAKDLAQQALDTYKALADPMERQHFSQEFEAQGNGKSTNSLKFVVNFHKSILNSKTTETAIVENMFTRSI